MKFLVFLLTICALHANATPVDSAAGIDHIMTTLYQRGQFNGSILVAVNGKIIYRNAFGESNFDTHEKFAPATISCLASLSKQFTAMTVMMLKEEQKINYDDPVSKYIPELSSYAYGITIRHLLTHTSGIPDVGDLGIDNPALTNTDVLKALMKKDAPTLFRPGTKYQYSNTGYMLLATIVERITNGPFKYFLTEKIIVPLQMQNTFVYDGSQKKPPNTAVGYSQFGQLDDYNGKSEGASGMYSCVDDLLKWDQALYSEKLVKQSTLDTAFTPAHVAEGKTTYGFGWNITGTGGDKVVWHTGSTAGLRAFIERRLKDRVTIIMLTNKGNSRRVEINDAIVNLLAGLSYKLPKIPISEKMYEVINKTGIQSAANMYNALIASKDSTYDFAESELNTLGYQLLGENKSKEGIAIFELNTKTYPNSSNAFDSLGDAYASVHDKDLAIKNYQKAVDLDKNNLESQAKLKKLKQLN